jgi:Amiloride-sensitive sodium channel.
VQLYFLPKFVYFSFIWALAVISAVYGAVWLSLNMCKRYNDSPTAISMERNFMDWPTALPAATVCFREKVDEDKLQAYVDK